MTSAGPALEFCFQAFLAGGTFAMELTFVYVIVPLALGATLALLSWLMGWLALLLMILD